MKNEKKKHNPGLSTTTMVDVLFILLIFFVLVSTIKKDSIDIKAAKVNKDNESSNDDKKKEEHVVTVDSKNNVFIDGKQLNSSDELKSELTTVKEKIPKDMIPVIVLRPDAGSQSSKLIEIFGVLNEVGLADNVQIEVEKK